MAGLEEERLELRRRFVDNGLFNFKIKRLTVYTDLLKIYETNVKLTTLELRVKFNGETGIDGGGLTRELFPVFWKSAENIMCEGSSAKIPVLSPEYVSHYFLLGKILSHGFILTGFLPIGLASTFLCQLLSQNYEIADDVLFNDFLL